MTPTDDTAPSVLGEDAVPSLRLRQILRTYCRGLDAGGLSDLRRSVLAGRYPWLRTDLTAALRADDLPAGWWHESVGDSADATATEKSQHDVWQALFPADPFPDPVLTDQPRR